MKFRIATFNVENLFRRPKAMNVVKWSDGQPILSDYSKLNALLSQDTYSTQDKDDILEILNRRRPPEARPNNSYLELRVIRGQLLQRFKNKPAVVRANGRNDWIGWVELKKESINDEAIRNVGRVVAEVNPDS